MSSTTEPEGLYLTFHGRIIDSLGIQMYQSPVAAIAELISNAWDADATEVYVDLPDILDQNAIVRICDNGSGMMFSECQNAYLNVGRDRRAEGKGSSPLKHRPVLGRKGIGKFAGFGIAQVLTLDTVSQETGERTKFSLDLAKLRGEGYAEHTPKPIDLLVREPESDARRSQHGTTVTLSGLKISRRPNPGAFRESMARRFLLAQAAADFRIFVNDVLLPDAGNLADIEYEFPRDYLVAERPPGLVIDGRGWGRETLDSGDEIRWRIRFTKDTIKVEEIRGIAVFCRGKLAQSPPFFFELSGGLGGQFAQSYMSGQIQADYLDGKSVDVITTERQRINWELPETQGLREWGQRRVERLMVLWKERRAEHKTRIVEDRLAGFAARLALMPSTEQTTIKKALRKLGQVEALTAEQFADLAEALLTAWESGRLRELVTQVADADSMDGDRLVRLLVEEQVLSALHVMETVRAKIDVLRSLKERIASKELELAVRNFIAKHPWLISPEWETFVVEKNIQGILDKAAVGAQLDKDPDWAKPGRVDLVLSSGQQLVVLEFMRPGLDVDYDHLSRFQRYVNEVRSALRANTGLKFNADLVTGLLVADKLLKNPSNLELIHQLREADMRCLEWPSLLDRAESQWRDFMNAVKARAPDDLRVRALATILPAEAAA